MFFYSTNAKQWTIGYCDPNTEGKHIIKKRRLSIIISNDTSNKTSSIANVVLCSTQVRKAYLPINYKFYCETTQLWNIAMANQIFTLPIIEIEQTDEVLSDEDIEGLQKALSIQFSTNLKNETYEPAEIIRTKQIPIEIIKEITMADIDEKYKDYLEAKQFEAEAKRLTVTALDEYTKAFNELKEKVAQHSAIIDDRTKGPVKAAYESKSDTEEPKKTSVIKKAYSEPNEMGNKNWTKKEISILKGYTRSYINNNISQLQELLGRTEKAIKIKVSRLGIK